MKILLFSAIVIWCVGAVRAESSGIRTSFAEFDKKAKAGERLSVVFFGASLTWGANASDPMQTSYRGQIAKRLEEAYPLARFKFWDAAIGGTGSQLGVFRFQRDVLSRHPDLVFLDFSANDDINSADPETLASYESLVRQIVTEANAPCVQVIFPFMWNISSPLESMKRRTAHLAIAAAYHVPVGDAIELCQKRVQNKDTTLQQLWPFDGVHPGDAGYVVFADAAWQAFQSGVQNNMICAAPEKMLNADTYMKRSRVRLSSLGTPPAGWHVDVPNPVSAYFDMLMSRWLDDETIASNKNEEVAGKKQLITQEVAPFTAKFRGSMIMFFAESTIKSCKYHVYIDDKLIEHTKGKNSLREFDGGELANMVKGNCHHAQVIATNLDISTDHTLRIEPIFSGDAEQELRLESICVAGGDARVFKE